VTRKFPLLRVAKYSPDNPFNPANHYDPGPANHADDLGELSVNPFNPDPTSNPFGAGSPFKPDGLNHPFSPYGSPFSNQSATNPYATDAPRLYDQQGNYRGKLSAKPNDSDGIANATGTASVGFNNRNSSWEPKSVDIDFVLP